MSRGPWLAATIVLAFVAAVAGVGVGRRLWPGAGAGAGGRGADLHALLHHRLALDAAQAARLARLEADHAARRRALEAEMRADNARLAAAIAAEHGYGPAVEAAVNASHAAMGALQKETLAHVFAMRQLLRPDQAARFDQAVTETLTAPQP